jgi:hypothetical protein
MEIKDFLISHLTKEQKEKTISINEFSLKEIIEVSYLIDDIARRYLLAETYDEITQKNINKLVEFQTGLNYTIENELEKLNLKK